jgi:hypothetical protein
MSITMKDIKLKDLDEAQLKRLSFKKKWLDDKSGYWYEFTPKVKGIPTNIVYDQDYNDLTLRVKILNDYKPFKREKYWSMLYRTKATLLNYKKLLIIAYGIHTSTEKPSSSSLHGGTKLSKKPTKKSKAGRRNTSNGSRRTTVS